MNREERRNKAATINKDFSKCINCGFINDCYKITIERNSNKYKGKGKLLPKHLRKYPCDIINNK